MGVVGSGQGVQGVWWVQEATVENWAALEALVAEHPASCAGLKAADFMWMAEVLLTDGVVVQMYKDALTRRYLCLGDDGNAYRQSGDVFLQHACLCDAVAELDVGS